MSFTIKTEKSYKIYAEVLEDSALKQFEEAMNLPEVVGGALMADAHTGYSLPIGGVVATKGAIFPAFVGYDIGCGMSAAKLDIKATDLNLKELFDNIYINMPVGRAAHEKKQAVPEYKGTRLFVKENINKKGVYQIGTLGSGNHFLEVGEGKDGKIWIIVHSGSRNMGAVVADFYMKKTAEISLNIDEHIASFEKRNSNFLEHNPEDYAIALERFVKKTKTKVLKKADLEGHHSLPVDSEYGKNYIEDMEYCLEYALCNRKAMVDNVIGLMGNPERLEFINRNHNHAELKDGLWIHRKGATHAEEGMSGVIPGNMRDGCFIVKGKGNSDSLYSSSHGAGRVLSRMKAKEKLNMEDFENIMTKAGVIAKVEDSTLDESPEAYKNIFEVIAAQDDLIEVIDHVRPLVNIKG